VLVATDHYSSAQRSRLLGYSRDAMVRKTLPAPELLLATYARRSAPSVERQARDWVCREQAREDRPLLAYPAGRVRIAGNSICIIRVSRDVREEL
jgi:hypothetical protein